MNVSISIEHASLGQKLIFEALVLPDINDVLRMYAPLLVDENELKEREEK